MRKKSHLQTRLGHIRYDIKGSVQVQFSQKHLIIHKPSSKKKSVNQTHDTLNLLCFKTLLFWDFCQGPVMPKMPQMDLIAELKKRQVKPQVREGKDGALEDIITGTVT